MSARWLLGWAYDGYLATRYIGQELLKELDYLADDAMDVWGDDDE